MRSVILLFCFLQWRSSAFVNLWNLGLQHWAQRRNWTMRPVRSMFSFPLPLSIYRELFACEVTTGHNTQTTLCLYICACASIMGQGLCQCVSNTKNSVNTITAVGTNCECSFFFCVNKNSPEILCVRETSRNEEVRGMPFLCRSKNDKRVAVIFLEEQWKRELTSIVSINITLSHSQSPSIKGRKRSSISDKTHLPAKTTWAMLFLKSRLRILRKKGQPQVRN